MNIFYITFRSVTFAQQGEKLLVGRGFRCRLMRTPRWMEVQGCGYCLRFHGENILPAVELLRERGLPLRKIYRQDQDGTMEEVRV